MYTGFSLLGGWGVPHTSQKFAHLPLSSTPNLYSLPTKSQCNPIENKNVICSCTFFVLISCTLKTQIILILILIDIQYSQNAVFSLESFPNRQNHSTW